MKEAHLVIYAMLCMGVSIGKAQSDIFNKAFGDKEVKCKVKADASASQDSICLGYSDSLTVSASGGTAPYTYSWAPPTGLSCTSCQNPIATPTITTSYTVTVTDNNGCTVTAKVRVKVNQPPVFSANANLALLLAGDSLHATGGDPPYTYTWAPPVSSSLLLKPPFVTTTYTLTVTGANGCSSSDTATYIPLPNKGACGTIFISEYIQDTLHHDDAIELYNPTASDINLKDYYLFGTTNGSLFAPPFIIRLHGTIHAHKTFLIANSLADTALTNRARMLTDSLNFGGKDIVALAYMTVSISGISVMALDQVGSVSPLPTDSGWAVSTGSTKNHTLVRQTGITQGDIIWATCRSQWNLYTQGTFTYIGHYKNACYTDPDLTLSLGNPTEACGSPSYFRFAIMASSNPSTIFNSCSVEFKYTGGEFSGDLFTNGNIVIEPGPDFLDYGPHINISQLSDSTMSINFGNASDSTVNGTLLNDTAKEMILIGLQIQNICQPGQVSFYDTTLNYSHYAVIDSSGHRDSVRSSYDTCCAYVCGDTLGPWYYFDYYCCDTDALGNCIQYCPGDSSNLWPVHCYDTTWHYRVDTTYNIISYSNLAYNNVIYTDDSLNTYNDCPPFISNFSAPIDAGVGDILTISGSNFGATQGTGQVKFYDADTANYYIKKMNASDYISWTNSQIKIRLPAFVDSVHSFLSNHLDIGGNNFRVENSCNDSSMSNLNTHGDPFSVYYNINQDWNYSTNQKNEVLLRNIDNNGGYVFHLNPISFPVGSIQRAVFAKAMADWTCFVGMKWTIGSDTIIPFNPNVGRLTGINYVFFTDSLTSPTTVAQTDLAPSSGCLDSIVVLKEGDIFFNSDTTHVRFNYDTTELVAIGHDTEDFYGVCLHELAHFIGLRHSTDPTSLMFWVANQGPISIINRLELWKTTCDAAVQGARYSVRQSKIDSGYCSGYTHLIPANTSCLNTTSVSEVQQSNTFSIYPNPTQGTFTIETNLNDYTLVISNILGQRILTRKVEQEKIEIDISNLSNGMYFIQEEYKTGMASQKLMIIK